MAVNEKISTLVKNQFPDFYKEDGEKFLAFMEAYYEYMEQNGKLTDAVKNLQSYNDVTTTTEEYLDYFVESFLPSLPIDVLADKRLMVKYIKEGNLARGTLESYKFLFRALYNEDLQLSYPADQILKVSDGDWRKDRYLVADFDTLTYDYIGKTIIGNESGATALVEDVVGRVVRGRHLMQILLSNIEGTFNHLETVRLLSDTNSTGHLIKVDAGINTVTMVTPGGEYQPGDVVPIISDEIGDFGKVVVMETIDLGGILTYSIIAGGSGYVPSTQTPGTTISFIGGDGTSSGSFDIERNDLGDLYEITTCVSFIQANTLYSGSSPTIGGHQMVTFANTYLSSPSYGFPETSENLTDGGINFHDNELAVLTIANTDSVQVGDSLYEMDSGGTPTGANAEVVSVIKNTSPIVLKVNGYKNFDSSSSNFVNLNFANSSGSNVGLVSAYSANAISKHMLRIGNTSAWNVSVGDEVVGLTSNCYGVIKGISSITPGGYTHTNPSPETRDLVVVMVSANNTANSTNQFDVGSIKPKSIYYSANNTRVDYSGFLEEEALRLVGSSTVVANVSASTSNTVYENHWTKLEDSILFDSEQIGTIERISNPVGGSGYSIAPTIDTTNSDIAALGIGEAVLILESTDANWATGNSQFTRLDTTDRITQTSTGAIGNVKEVTLVDAPDPLGVYRMSVRVWQPMQQREPGNINWANNTTVTLESITGDIDPGSETDNRTVDYTGTATITSVTDYGVLGKNATIKANVGANGTIYKLRVVDSGFSYKHLESAAIAATNRPLATQATVTISLGGAANAEGYYASTRSHISTPRGYIQDSYFYQEFSYQIISAIALPRYRDVALQLVHPAGQKLFGKFSTDSVANVQIIASSTNNKRALSNGTVTLTEDSFDISGSGTDFLAEFANNDNIIIKTSGGDFLTIPLNIVSNDTTANTKISWANSTVSGLSAYYSTGSM
jgi:hypothetical protein